MAKKIEIVGPVEAKPLVDETKPKPDALGLPVLRTLLGELRKMGPKRAANHELAVSSDLIGAMREQSPNLKPGEARIFGVPFVVDGNLDGLAYRLTKKAPSK